MTTKRLRWTLILLLAVAVPGQSFCPDFLAREKACSCFAYLDGAVIKCHGPSATSVVEKLKEVQTEIRELAIEDASIIEIGPRAFRNLRIKSLILDNNRIKTIHQDAFRGLESSLVSLSIAHNKLTDLPTDALMGMNALQILNLQCNNIGNIYTPVFRNVSRLIELNLACNQICKISGSAFESVKDTLQSLILDQNCFKEIPAEALRNFKQLLALHMQYNEIGSIDKLQLMNMISLLMVRLTGNKIRTIDRYGFNNVPNLRYLFLDRNELTGIEPNTLQQFKYLEIVDLSYNSIGEITKGAFLGLEHLMQLNLEGNAIKDIAPAAFANTPLLLLLLGHNCLTAVNQQMFQGIPFLKQLSLTHNNLRLIQPFSFSGSPTLNMLDLSRNKLELVAPSSVTVNSQVTVLMQENPMVCRQGGYHIIQGTQPILLLNEMNIVCKSHNATNDDMCPTRKEVPQAPPCCPVSTVLTNTITTTADTSSRLFTVGPPVFNNVINVGQTFSGNLKVPGLREKVTDVLPLEDNGEDIKIVAPITSSTIITVATTTTNPPNEKNMERFWRFTAPPRKRGEQRSSVTIRKLNTINSSTPSIETETAAAEVEKMDSKVENLQATTVLAPVPEQRSRIILPPQQQQENVKLNFPRTMPHINGQATGFTNFQASNGPIFGLGIAPNQNLNNFQPANSFQPQPLLNQQVPPLLNNNFQTQFGTAGFQPDFRQTPLQPQPNFNQFPSLGPQQIFNNFGQQQQPPQQSFVNFAPSGVNNVQQPNQLQQIPNQQNQQVFIQPVAPLNQNFPQQQQPNLNLPPIQQPQQQQFAPQPQPPPQVSQPQQLQVNQQQQIPPQFQLPQRQQINQFPPQQLPPLQGAPQQPQPQQQQPPQSPPQQPQAVPQQQQPLPSPPQPVPVPPLQNQTQQNPVQNIQQRVKRF